MSRGGQVAKNEALFRDVNEGVARLNERFDVSYTGPEPLLEFLCECGNDGCLERIRLTRAEYERVRSDPRHFAIVPGHQFERLDRVIEENERFAVAEKPRGEDAVALETDPRA